MELFAINDIWSYLLLGLDKTAFSHNFTASVILHLVKSGNLPPHFSNGIISLICHVKNVDDDVLNLIELCCEELDYTYHPSLEQILKLLPSMPPLSIKQSLLGFYLLSLRSKKETSSRNMIDYGQSALTDLNLDKLLPAIKRKYWTLYPRFLSVLQSQFPSFYDVNTVLFKHQSSVGISPLTFPRKTRRSSHTTQKSVLYIMLDEVRKDAAMLPRMLHSWLDSFTTNPFEACAITLQEIGGLHQSEVASCLLHPISLIGVLRKFMKCNDSMRITTMICDFGLIFFRTRLVNKVHE